MKRRAPRPLAFALEKFDQQLGPATPLAAVESVWEQAVGSQIAAVAVPVSERRGTVTVACESAVWRSELGLMSEQLLASLNSSLDGSQIEALKFTVSKQK